MNFYKRFIGDFQSKTSHLSLVEIGAYDRLLDHYYSTECLLPANKESCYRIARAMNKQERDAVNSVLEQFFSLESEGYANKRADKELQEAMPKIEAARENGARGGRPKKQKNETQQKPTGFSENNPTDNPLGFENETQQKPSRKASQSQNQNINTNTPLPPTGGVARFDAFWQAYPKKVGKDVAKRAFDKRKVDDDLLAEILKAVKLQAASPQWAKDGGQFIPNPATWLNGGRWQDEVQSAGDVVQADDSRPDWAVKAGFANVWEANNEGCFRHNAAQFRNGKKLDEVAA